MLGSSSPTVPAYTSYPRSPYIRRISPPGSPAPTKKTCCYELQQHQQHQQYQQNHSQTETFLCCCYSIPTRSSTSILATLGVCFLVLAYTILGAFTFMTLEGGSLKKSYGNEGFREVEGGFGVDLANELRSQTVDRLWSITENLNILYRENWTKLAAEEVLEFQEALFRILKSKNSYLGGDENGVYGGYHGHKWTFTSSFLYSLTLITTIGYGSVAPRTAWGKLVTIVYALIGIPLMLLYLSTTGDVLARSFRKLYGKICGAISLGNSKRSHCQCNGGKIRVPITLCLIIILAYICSGAFLFHRLENWSILDGSYFCFTSLGTIGFGDLLPGQKSKQKLHNSTTSSPNLVLGEDKVSLFACSAYILTGMALVAMCFSLVQEEVISLLRFVGASCASNSKLRKTVDNDEMLKLST